MGARGRRSACAAAALLLLLAGAGHAQAASEDECAGWLCIAVGFGPPECRPAYVAMRKRLFEFKSPLPSFGSCSADGSDNGFDMRTGTAARMGSGEPATYRMNTRCLYDDDNRVEGDRIPQGCTGTYRYFIVTQHGEQIGETFFNPMPRRGGRERGDID